MEQHAPNPDPRLGKLFFVGGLPNVVPPREECASQLLHPPLSKHRQDTPLEYGLPAGNIPPSSDGRTQLPVTPHGECRGAANPERCDDGHPCRASRLLSTQRGESRPLCLSCGPASGRVLAPLIESSPQVTAKEISRDGSCRRTSCLLCCHFPPQLAPPQLLTKSIGGQDNIIILILINIVGLKPEVKGGTPTIPRRNLLIINE